MMPHEILDKVIYRDAMMLVVDKPSGIPVHKGKGGGINLEQFFPLLRYGLPRNPALAHRLDKDTSGCLILGRHRKALAKLADLFKRGDIKKTYWAIVEGQPPQDEGVIDLPIGQKDENEKNWHMMVREDGQKAVTEYKVLKKMDGFTWLELRPLTGRTHQLRVHCQAIGCPIKGDKIYGNGDRFGVMYLHARSITIPFYKNKDAIIAEAPPPDYFNEFIQ